MKALLALLVASGTAFAGSVVANPPVTFIVSGTGTGMANTSLQNTSGGAFNVELVQDASCDPEVSFSVAGGNPFVLNALSSKTIGLACTATKLGAERCLVHATDANTGAPLADLMAVCENVTAATLTPSTISLAFGSVAVGDSSAMPLQLTNNGPLAIRRLFFQTDELDDNFEVALPCNPDGAACDGPIAALPTGAATIASVRCAPHSAGLHTVHLEVATDTGLHLAQKVTLTCTGTAATTAVLGVEPSSVAIAAPVEVTGSPVQTSAVLSNLGVGSLLIKDIRTVDVDPDASFDWGFTLSGTCTSVPCTLGAGQQVAIDLAFHPDQIAARHASLLVTFVDTIARTRSIPLSGIGQGATLQLFATPSTLELGSVPLGHSTSATLHFSNTGNRDTTVGLAVSPVGPYTLAPPSTLVVTPIANADVMATCTPAVTGTNPTEINANDNDTLTPTTIAIPTTCTGITTPLYATPTAVDFGEVRLDAGPVTMTVQLLSNGSALTITGTPHLDTANVNISIGAPKTTATPSSIDVTITPQTEGDLTSHIVVEDTAGDTLLVPIRGRVVSAMYQVPATLDIGTFCVGQPTASSNLTFSSIGTATIEVAQPTVPDTSGFDLGLTSPTIYPAALFPAKSAIVAVTPQRQATATTLSANVTWSTDVLSQPVTTTTVIASFVASGGAISPSRLDFGDEPVHLFRADGQRVILQNCNGSVLQLDPPTIRPPFFVDSPSFPTSLEPNETATFSVGFHPTRLGTFDDMLTISSPQLPNMPLQVILHGNSVVTSGTATPDGGQPTELGSTTFYACSCNSNSPGGGAPIVLALLAITFRRRGGSS